MLTLKPLGMEVKVTENIKGFVPNLHLADVKLKQPEKKYSTGSTVKCRVRFSCKELNLNSILNIFNLIFLIVIDVSI